MLRAALLLVSALLAWGQEVTVELGTHGEVILEMQADTVGGATHPLRMLLDTGAVQCVLDPAAAQGLVRANFKRATVGGFAGGERPALLRRLIGLRSGALHQTDVPVLVLDLTHVNRGLDHPVDGLLGMNFLEGRRFTVDLAKRRLVWDGEAVAGREVLLTQRDGDARFWAPVRLNGRELEALMDTGASVALVVPQNLPSHPLPDCDIASAVDGTRIVREARAKVEALGERYGGRRALVGGAHPILGLPFLATGPTTFDFKHQRLYLGLAEGHLPLPKEEGARSLPLAWNRAEGPPFLEVEALPSCHRWYRAGFRKGDRILAAGPLRGSELTLTGLDAPLGRGEILDWTVQRGKRTLTLQNPNEDPRQEPLDRPDLAATR